MKYEVLTIREKEVLKAVEDIEKDVKKHIKDGWKPNGGVSITFDCKTGEFVIIQSITKEEN